MNIHVDHLKNEQELRHWVLECDRDLEERMAEVARKVAADPDLHLIGLTGPTCSGKTTTARLLTEEFQKHQRRVHVISIDDFYYDKSVLQARADRDPDIEVDYDSEDTIDAELLEEKTQQLLEGKKTRLPRFDFHSGMRCEGTLIEPRPEDVFLFEGIQVLYPSVDALLRKSNYQSIYIRPVSTIYAGNEEFDPNEIRLMRRLVRDYLHRSTDPEFTFYVWQSVRENEEKSIFPYAHTCNYFIDSTMPYEIGMLKPYLEQLLGKIPPEGTYYKDAQEVLRQLVEVQAVPSSYMTPNSLYKEFI